YSPALTDFVLMTRESRMFLTGPGIVAEAMGEQVSAEELGGPRVHERNGVCQLVAEDDAEAIYLARELLSYLPQNAYESVPTRPYSTRSAFDPAGCVPDEVRRVYDVRDVIRALADNMRI